MFFICRELPGVSLNSRVLNLLLKASKPSFAAAAAVFKSKFDCPVFFPQVHS